MKKNKFTRIRSVHGKQFARLSGCFSNLAKANAVLIFQTQLQILTHITQHTVSSSVYARVWVAEGIQVKEATEAFKRFQRRAERNSMEFELERNPGKKLLPQRLS